MEYMVLEDLRQQYLPGTVVDAAKAQQLIVEEVVTIPVCQSLFAYNAVSGFYFRQYGHGQLVPNMPGMCGQMLMFAHPGLHSLNWVAKISATSVLRKEIESGKPPQGTLRIVADSGQNVFAGGVANLDGSIVDLSKLTDVRADGTWIVRARARLDMPTTCFAGFALWGGAREMRVSWVALSQTE
jgi:hypothetical protein